MKMWSTLGAIALLSAVVGVAWHGRGGRPSASGVSSPQAAAPIGTLSVDTLMKQPDDFQGSIRVEGVVASVHPDKQAFTLIDRREFVDCASVTCAKLSLPVRWAGAPPGIEQVVQVHGQVVESGGKLVFVAEAVDVAQP